MPMTVSSVSAEAQAGFAADLPLISPRNFARNAVRTRWTSGGSWADTALDRVDYPSSFAVDGHAMASTVSSSGASPIYLLIELDPAPLVIGQSVRENRINVVMIQHDNLHAITKPVTIAVEVSDNEDYSASLQIAQWSVTAYRRQRFVSLNLGGSFASYAGVRFVRITIEKAGGTPALSEVWIGDRIQFARAAVRPFESFGLGWLGSSARTEGGITLATPMALGGQSTARRLVPLDGEDAIGLDDAANVRRLWRESEYGAHPFLSVEAPSSAPNHARIMRFPGLARAELTRTNALQFISSVSMNEQPPYLDPEMEVIG